jgi:hypothetical protein
VAHAIVALIENDCIIGVVPTDQESRSTGERAGLSVTVMGITFEHKRRST